MRTNKVLFVIWFIMTILIIASIFGMLYGKEMIRPDTTINEYVHTGEYNGVIDLLPAPLGISLILLYFMFLGEITDFISKKVKG